MKKILIFGLSLSLVFALSACGKDDETSTGEFTIPTELTTETIEIEMWHAMGEDNMATLDAIIEDFNVLYPNITISHSAQGGYETLRDNTVTAITGGEAPDLVLAYPDHTALYLSGEVLVPLDGFIESEEWGFTQAELDDFIPSYLNEGKIYDDEGTYYALPFNKSTELMFYNKTALDSAPTTWDEVAALELTSYVNSSGETVTPEYAVSYDSSSNLFITLSEQYGASYTDFVDGEGSFTFNNDETKGMLQDVLDLFDDNKLVIPGFYDQDYGSTQLANGLVLASIGSSAGAKYNATTNFEIGVASVPQYDADNKAVIQQGTNINMLGQNSDDEKLASWLFMKYLVSTEANTKFAISSGYLPVLESAFQSTEYQEFISYADKSWDEVKDDVKKVEEYLKAKASVVAYEQRDAYFVSIAFVGSSQARDEVGFVVDNLILFGVDISEELTRAYEELTW